MIQKIRSFLFENKTTKQTVTKNAFWLTVSNFGGRLIKAGVIVYAARALGTANYGVFSYAITLAAFLTLFMDPGINSILMRDASKSNDTVQREFFSTMLVLKAALLVIGVSIILLVAPFFSTLPGAKIILPIVAAVLALDTLREFLTSLLRAKERMEWDAGIFLLTNLGILVFGFLFLTIRATPGSFAWAYVAGDVMGITLAIWVIRAYFKNLASHISLRRILPILNAAWPFAITGALGALLTSADILIISWMRSASDVGIYSAAIRIVQVLYLIPGIFQISTLPLLSRLANVDPTRFRAMLERTVKIVLLAAAPLAVGGTILGTLMMALVFGAPYAVGGLAFKILIVGLLFDFPTVVISSAIFAYNHQKSLIATSAIGGIANVALDLLLIPHFGIAGSAVATLGAQILANWYLWHVMKKINYFEVGPALGKIAAATAIMAVFTLALFAAGANVIVNIGISGIVYLLALYFLREPLFKELKGIFIGERQRVTG